MNNLLMYVFYVCTCVDTCVCLFLPRDLGVDKVGSYAGASTTWGKLEALKYIFINLYIDYLFNIILKTS